MATLLELFPLIIFFVVYQLQDIYWATGALMAAAVVQLIITYFSQGTIPKKQWLFLAIIVIFGGLTVILRDDTFIKWKPTIVYIVFFVGMLVSQWMGMPAIKGLLGSAIAMPDRIWNRLNTSWAVFFLLSAIANLVVAYGFREEIWVHFETWGMVVVTLLFCVGSILAVHKHITEVDEQAEENK